MFRLNGDIIKQLETIYAIKFKQRYRSEIKERIIFFINSIYGSKTLNELKQVRTEILIEDFEFKVLYMTFFLQYKEALLNSFNPIWYSTKKVYSEAELNEITLAYIVQELSTKKDLFVELTPSTYDLSSVIFSKKIYKFMENKILDIIVQILSSAPFKNNPSIGFIEEFRAYLSETTVFIPFEYFIEKHQHFLFSSVPEAIIFNHLIEVVYLYEVFFDLNQKH